MLLLVPALAGVASAALPDPVAVEEVLRRANDYFIANHAVGDADWKRGAYQTGNYAAYGVLGETVYRDRALAWAAANSWGLGKPFGGNQHRLHADSQVAGQVYLDLYREDPQPLRRTASAQVAQELVDDVFWNDGRGDTLDNVSEDDWWWVDAYYMAAPMLARMAAIDGNEAYRTQLRAMYDWMKDTRTLFDPVEGLWYRDAASKTEISSIGGKVFWSRGNGWVMAGLARVLDELPPSHPDRAEFETMLQTMAAALVPLQGADGFWRSSLQDAAKYPNPETSGTAFFTAAMAWGIRNGVLDAATYEPVLTAAWDGLTSIALAGSGRVGYIQGVGRAPAAASSTETYDFGVGAFLLASSEVLLLTGGAVPVLPQAGANQLITAGPGVYEAEFLVDGSGSVLRSGSIVSASWWVGSIFLAEGLSTTLTLPRGEHVLTLRIEHSGGDVFEDSLTATLGSTGDQLPVAAIAASTWQNPNVPANTRDGDLGTRWSAEGNGQWIQFDLGTVQPVASVEIAIYLGNTRVTYFDIAFSTDGVAWQTVVPSGESSATTLELERFSTGGQSARYVRIVGYGNSSSAWNSLTEVVINTVPGVADGDGNGLPDAWESTRLGTTGGDPDGDSDHDGFMDWEEFEAGTDPDDGGDFLQPQMISTGNGMAQLTFLARAAFGAGYDGKIRTYTIETRADLRTGSWQPMPGVDPIQGDNLSVSITVPPGFYRLRAVLE